MGCCSSTAQPAEEDLPRDVTAFELQLWAELDEISFASSAETAEEATNCARNLRQYAITVHAKLVHGITGTMDTTPDGKIYEAVEIAELRPKQTKRIEEWLKGIELSAKTLEPPAISQPGRYSETSSDVVDRPAAARALLSPRTASSGDIPIGGDFGTNSDDSCQYR